MDNKIQNTIDEMIKSFEEVKGTPEEKLVFLEEMNQKIKKMNGLVKDLSTTARKERERLRIEELQSDLRG